MLEVWEKEVVAQHRWGRLFQWFNTDKDAPDRELGRLRRLAEKAGPLDRSCKAVVGQIVALEICNWNLEESILELCRAIGAKAPSQKGIGHMASMSRERWKRVWAYYLTLRNWLPSELASGYQTLLETCDPVRAVQEDISRLLGERTRLKELYVERFCICLERWLGGWPRDDSIQMGAHEAAVEAVEKEIKRLDPQSSVVHELVFKSDGNGRLNLCNHKAFHRYDLIISSIGAERWRAGKPMKGTDGLERAATLEKYLSPIEAWIGGSGKGGMADEMHKMLGEQNDIKLFLASLLVSLLRPQQLAAKRLAESRARGVNG